MLMLVPLLPLAVHTVGVRLVKVTGLPDAPPVALTDKPPSVKKRLSIGLKVIVCAAGVKVMVRVLVDSA